MMAQMTQTATIALLPRRAARRSEAHVAANRRRAIERYRILDTLPEPDFDAVATLAAKVCETPFAAISFIDGERQWFKAQCGLGVRETPISQSFCAHTIRQDDILLVADAAGDPRFAVNPLVTGAPHFRFYAGMPVRAADGTPIAALCVLDDRPRPGGLSETQRMTLTVLARQVEAQLDLRRAVIERDAHAEEQRAMARELRHVAEHDPLTGLPNRTLFDARLADALRGADATRSRTALMLVDVDHFKQVNDSLGHDAGDALLCSFANRLRSMVRANDTVARLGGDEFAVLLAGIDRDEELAAVIRSLDDRLRQPVRHAGRTVDCRASIGIAIYPDHAGTAEGLVKCSDLALAAAKAERGRAIVFRSEMAQDFHREGRLLALVRAAVEDDRIVPFYQPKIDLGSGALVGFEALVRRVGGGGAAESPDMFAAAFADRELSAEIGRRMVARVCADMRAWSDARIAFGHVAINSCAADFAGNDLAERLLAAIGEHGLRPDLFELEVTEGVFLGRSAHHVARALEKLGASGMRIALDDFGTGYASLTHLKQFPVDVLKIDRSFVAGLGHDADDAAIVRALIGLGRSLGIETVAEGIETPEQAAFVRAHGCTLGQGFLYGAAHPARDIPAMIAGFATKAVA